MRTHVVNIGNAPVIFPRLTMWLVEAGENLRISGKREADLKLAALMFMTLFDETKVTVPDVMYYNVETKEWFSIYLEGDDSVELCNRGKLITTVYSLEKATSVNYLTTLLRNFVVQFSSATISL